MKQKMKKILIVNIVITILMITFLNLLSTKSMAANQIKSDDINAIDTSKYPQIKEMILKLKEEHPNWSFKVFYTNLDWSEVIANEYVGHGKSPSNLVPADSKNYSGEWICPICGETRYDTGKWVCASESAIKYMMDPRNSLNSADIFQFMELSYNENTQYSKEIIRKMLSGTFLDDDKYVDIIMNTSIEFNMNPYYVVARIFQEQKPTGTALTKGEGINGNYIGYYNVFNIGASGSDNTSVITNGLKWAQKYGWTSLELSISGGIKIITNNYIAKGQDTLYFQKFDVVGEKGGLYSNQYMQNILAAQNEGTSLRKKYSELGKIEENYTFIIPLYENMPSLVCTRPSIESSNSNITTDLVKVNVNSKIQLRNSPNGTKIGYLYKDEIVTRLEKATEKQNGTYWDKVKKTDGTIGYVARETYDYESDYKLYLIELNTNENTDSEDNDSKNENLETENPSDNNEAENPEDNTTNDYDDNTTNTPDEMPEINNSRMKSDTNTNILKTVPGVTGQEVLDAMKKEFIIKNGNGEEIDANQNLGTGYSIGEKYNVVVLGDINGDGFINTGDTYIIKLNIMEKNPLEGLYFKAADINNDGSINTGDSFVLKIHVMDVEKITLN